MADEGSRLVEELMRFKPDRLTANAWAVQAGVSRTIWADLRRHGNPSRKTLEKLLSAAGSSLAEFEALCVRQPAPMAVLREAGLAEKGPRWRPAPLKPIPLLACRPAGEWGEPGSGIELCSIQPIDEVALIDRPESLAADGDAYAVTVTGQAMWPRFRAGRRLLVSPAAPPRVGDDVLVQLASGVALIGEMVRRTAGIIELRQFNPDLVFAVDAGVISAIHKVIGEAI
ncbi:MAG: helix-turn-helix transcriptional regulator [Sphingomicrobium sp.]